MPGPRCRPRPLLLLGLLLCPSLARAQTALLPVTEPGVPAAPGVQAPALQAPPAPHFGTAGQRLVGANTGLNLSYQYRPAQGTLGRVDAYSLGLLPNFGLFLNDLFFVRVAFEVGYSLLAPGSAALTAGSTLNLGIAPGLGVNLPLAPGLSLAPSLFAGYMWTRERPPAVQGGSNLAIVSHDFYLGAQLPVVIEMTSHLSATCGPLFVQQLVERDNLGQSQPLVSQLALQAGLLGWY